MIPAWLSFFDALIALALIAAGPLGAHFGLFPAFRGFSMFILGALIAIFGLLLGLVGLLLTRKPEQRQWRPRAAFGASLCGIITVLFLALVAMRFSSGYPPINDITTDFADPPEFIHASEIVDNGGRNMKYDPTKYENAQKQGYANKPSIGPMPVDTGADATFAKVDALAKQMPTWEITYEDPKTRTIEGVATSSLFRFKDDFVIRVKAGDNGKSIVDMRSKSRDGIGDFGVNFNRIVDFMARLQQESGTKAS
jgi:uncharacterized protein (DUF1499 family)